VGEPSTASIGRLKPGAKIGRYRLLAPLASGGMADVWTAKPEGNLGLSRTVALKVVKGEYADDEEYTRMLVDEATVSAAVHHPNVCELYELDKQDGILFMVMEWVAGDSLAGLLHKASTLAPLKYHLAARIIAEACAGAHAAHEAVDQDGNSLSIVHRDISPPNILLSLQGQVKVTDFGIAKARYQLHTKTRTGEVKGKFAYIPPEQILGKGVDRRADVYALGCVLYVATLGLRPFGSGPRAMSKILAGDYKRPTELKPNYPEGLEEVIITSIHKDKEKRYPTAEAQRLAIEDWLSRSGHVVTAGDLARVVRRRLSEERRKAIEEMRKLSRAAEMMRLAQEFEADPEHEPTPTAASGLAVAPDDLRPGSGHPDEERGASTRSPAARLRGGTSSHPRLSESWSDRGAPSQKSRSAASPRSSQRGVPAAQKAPPAPAPRGGGPLVAALTGTVVVLVVLLIALLLRR
jgi:serine/threonine-protein kinase